MQRYERLFIVVVLLYLFVMYISDKTVFFTSRNNIVHKGSQDFLKKSRLFIWNDYLRSENDPTNLVTDGEDVEGPNELSQFTFQNIGQFRLATKILYNRIPKCGSTTLRSLITKLSKWNYFFHVSSEHDEPRVLNKSERVDFVKKVNSLPEPWIYDRHIHFINFNQCNHSMPVYINLVRDPVERFVSRYYHIRYITRRNISEERLNLTVNQCIENNMPECSIFSLKYDSFMLIPFFCGHDLFCTYPNENAIAKAKSNAVKHYAVIGITEKYEQFLELLEYLLPQFFEGVMSFYFNSKNHRNVGVRKDAVTLKNRRKMQDMMKIEYEFYTFLKARFYSQYDSLKIKRDWLK